MKALKLLFLAVILVSISNCSKHGDSYGGFGGFGTGGDIYNNIEENPFVKVSDQSISTFSIDADGASYANVRRFIQQDDQIPPKGAVRTEELLNYFNLDYDYSDQSHPINLNGEVSPCPWNSENKLIRIGIKGKPIIPSQLPASNFVFLIDVSGSMGSSDKLDLLKRGFKELVNGLTADDRVAIVTYASSPGVALASTPGNNKSTIKQAIDGLGAGGSTAGAGGITKAYSIAQQNLIPGGNNRIIIGTDGDFNVGISSQDDLVDLIESKRDLGIFLTVLGVGRGNLNDAAMEQMANNGNGTYEYIDNLQQMKKVFIYDFNKFFTVAKDVKVQVEFNPNNVLEYRLIGYENRLLSESEFTNDSTDAGEIGADQNITALYEIVPKINSNYKDIPTFTIDFRYKEPNSNTSVPMELDIFDQGNTFSQASDFMKFTSGVAAFSMLITNSPHKGTSNFNDIQTWLNSTNLNDPHNFKAEFKNLVLAAKGL